MVSHLSNSVAIFLKRDDGPTAVEYAVAVAFIILLVIGGLALLGGSSGDVFTTTSTSAGAPSSPN